MVKKSEQNRDRILKMALASFEAHLLVGERKTFDDCLFEAIGKIHHAVIATYEKNSEKPGTITCGGHRE